MAGGGGGGGGGGTIVFIVFSAVSRGGLWPKSGQAIARMPDRRLRPCLWLDFTNDGYYMER